MAENITKVAIDTGTALRVAAGVDDALYRRRRMLTI
jgi:hypothetical protein